MYDTSKAYTRSSESCWHKAPAQYQFSCFTACETLLHHLCGALAHPYSPAALAPASEQVQHEVAEWAAAAKAAVDLRAAALLVELDKAREAKAARLRQQSEALDKMAEELGREAVRVQEGMAKVEEGGQPGELSCADVRDENWVLCGVRVLVTNEPIRRGRRRQ